MLLRRLDNLLLTFATHRPAGCGTIYASLVDYLADPPPAAIVRAPSLRLPAQRFGTLQQPRACSSLAAKSQGQRCAQPPRLHRPSTQPPTAP